MWSRGDFDGSITINGSIEQRRLYVFLPGEDISISDNELKTTKHRCLSFGPCTPGMLTSSIPEVIRQGKNYKISGHAIGSFSEGRSFAYGDEEYDIRDVDEVTLEIAYFADGIDVAVKGIANPRGTNSKNLCAWEFAIRFIIPRTAVATFFNLNELGEETFAWSYDKNAAIRN
jgi:hypothetical protein